MENKIFSDELHVLNIGLSSFVDSIVDAGGFADHIDWQPPAQGNTEVGKQLATLVKNVAVEKANAKSFNRYLSANPKLVGVGFAGDDLPDFGERMILHAGPPIDWVNMCGPMQGAILGAIIFEEWADNVEKAEKLARSGDVKFEPNHHHASVGPMAGVISPSMPVWIVYNSSTNNYSYSNLNEGLGNALRFGANGKDVIERLHWMTKVMGPVLKEALLILGEVDLKPLMAQALHMGDEVHNRNVAASSRIRSFLSR